MAIDNAKREGRDPETAAPPAGGQSAARLQGLLRGVNRKIARRAESSATAAFVCECLDRGCAEAVEAPLPVFGVLATAGYYFLVLPGHDEPAERVVRRERGYVVVERRS